MKRSYWSKMASLHAHAPDSSPEQGQVVPYKFLVLIPFDAPSRRLRDLVKTTVLQARAEPMFPDAIQAGAVWVDEVWRLVRKSDAVIADVTQADPNVLFELGMAHGLGKPLMLLLDNTASTNLPSDLVGYQVITYSPEDLPAFTARLGRTVRRIAARREIY
jgi:hypothetical protein